MKKQFFVKTFAIFLALSFVLMNSAAFMPSKAGALPPPPTQLFYSSMEAPTFGPTHWSLWDTKWSQDGSDKYCDSRKVQ